MKYLTPQQILALHDQAIKRFGGSNGLRDRGLLESVAARPKASFGGKDLYPTVFDKAAALMHSLLKNHPFVDGNKRSALSAGAIFLMVNGYKLENRHKEELKLALNVENDSLDLEAIAAWLKKNCRKVKM